ncbi:MAG: DUF6789 family protein [Armatimonadota bacterium]
MVSDSPYQIGELLLRPLEGAVVGLVGSFVMLAAVSALGPGPQGMAAAWLGWMARIAGIGAGGPSIVTGLVLHGLVGAGLGVLYASSQQRLPWRPLVGIGAFYGLLLWIGGRILLGWLFSTPVHSVVHSWAWLAGACAYGMTLALFAGWAGARRPVSVVAVPRD